jgi:hypothetical protein
VHSQVSRIGQWRRSAWLVGVGGLLLLGAVSLVVGIAGPIVFALTGGDYGGGLALFFVAIPLLAAGLMLRYRIPFGRLVGSVVCLVYAAFLTAIWTTPLRGLTPPPGQNRAPLDVGLIALSAAFLALAVLVALGTAAPRGSSAGQVAPGS